jgi:arylsulfatase A-like enzyme
MRSPGIMSWPERIPAGQVLDHVGMAMDVFPTFLKAAGGDPTKYEANGLDVLPMVAEGAPSPHAGQPIFWEMGKQTAVRRDNWKLVLKGQLVEGAPPEDDVFLADLDADMAERTNLKEKHPDVVADLTKQAEEWRAAIETRWTTQWEKRAAGSATTYDA